MPDQATALVGEEKRNESAGVAVVDVGVSGRVHDDDAVWVEQQRIALGDDRQVEAVAEGEEGGAVAEGVGPLLVGQAEDLGHARTGFEIPVAFGLDPGAGPERTLLAVRAAVVAPRDERRFLAGDPLEPRDDPGRFAEAGGVFGRADEDEVVDHHVAAEGAITLVDEALLGGSVVDEEHVGVAATAQFQRLAGADSHDADIETGPLLEGGQEDVEKAAVAGAGRGRQRDRPGGLVARAAGRKDDHRGEQQAEQGSGLWLVHQIISPRTKAAARGLRGLSRKSAVGASSASSPPRRRATRSATRRSWKRL